MQKITVTITFDCPKALKEWIESGGLDDLKAKVKTNPPPGGDPENPPDPPPP